MDALRRNALFLMLILLTVGCELFSGDGGKMYENPGGDYVYHYEHPRWSPDGRTILYFSWGLVSVSPRFYDPDSLGIWAVEADGTGRRLVAQGAMYADWSPDGDWIVLESGAQLFKVSYDGHRIDTSSVVQLTDRGRNFFPEWSPDGAWIAYDRSLTDDSGPSGIWIVRPDGSEMRYVFSGVFPSWHSSSTKLVGSRGVSPSSIDRQVVVYDLSTSTESIESLLKYPDIRSLKLSPEGWQIVMQVRSWDMILVDMESLQITDFGRIGGQADWSPDGTRIVYNCGHICVMDADGRNVRHVVTALGAEGQFKP